jgi:hypothetical protein
MSNCKEYMLDDLMAITAIPVSDIAAGDVSSPVNKLTPTLEEDEFGPSLDNAIVIGLMGGGGAVLVPIKRLSGKVKDDVQDSVAGRGHTVTVTCEVDERGGELWAPVPTLDNMPCSQRLERVAHHLLLSFRDGTRGFASCTDDTYLCTIDRDGAKVNVTFKIQNIMGVQLLM